RRPPTSPTSIHPRQTVRARSWRSVSDIPADAAVTSTAADVEAELEHAVADDHGGHAMHTTTGLSNNKLGMWLFLGSECLLFGGLISTYMLYRGRHSQNLGPDQIYDIPFTSVSSFVLLM